MLTQTSINSTYALAGILQRAGKSLSVVPGTALADLIATCDPATEAFRDEAAEGEIITTAPVEQRVAEAALAESLPGVNDHDMEVVRVTDMASKAVAFTMDMARNVVNPKVNQVVEATEAYVDAYRRKRGEPVTILPVFLGSVYESAILGDMLARFRDSAVANVAPVRLTVQWPEGGASAALNTGVAELDAAVQKHFAGREDEVKALWIQFFGDEAGVYRPADMFEALTGMDQSLILFLGAHALLEGDIVPDGLNLSLQAYRAYIAQLEEQAAARLVYQHRVSLTGTRSNQLVISAPATPKAGQLPSGVVKVNGEVYNKWLSEGGSPEALFGAVATGTALHYHVVLDKAAELAAGWTRALGLVEQQLRFEHHSTVIQGLSKALIELAGTLPEGERRLDHDALHAEVAERLSHFHVKDLDNLYLVARKAVCRVFYPHTDAEKILNAMDAVVAAHPELAPREAALMVMIDYVTDWVGSSIVVDKIVADSRS